MNKDIPLETGLAIRKPPLIKPARLINRGCACGINKQSLNQYQVQFQIFPSLRSFTFSGQDQSYLYPMQRCDMIPVSINKSYDLPLKKRIMFLRLPRIITIRRGTSIFRTIRPATNTNRNCIFRSFGRATSTFRNIGRATSTFCTIRGTTHCLQGQKQIKTSPLKPAL